MAEVVWTFEARNWLRDVHDFIARDNPDAASSVVNGILECAGRLGSFPESGARIEIPGATCLRMVLYGHYRIGGRGRVRALIIDSATTRVVCALYAWLAYQTFDSSD